MCGRLNVESAPLTRFVLSIINAGLTSAGDGPPEAGGHGPDNLTLPSRHNVAPTEQIDVLRFTPTDGWLLQPMRWWLVPHWADQPSSRFSMFNARAETLARSRAFAEAYRSRRCIVPVSGYYEWRAEAGGKQPYYITAAADEGLALAGLWEHWQKDDVEIDSCTIITTAAPAAMRDLHQRMPVHLHPAGICHWLAPNTPQTDLAALLAPAVLVPLTIMPVSRLVNNARNKSADCAVATGPEWTVAAV
ncbi:MAG: SOS response-associated peptidase [Pseudomonadales bacterium]|jgi:putative SOS response-associated peptidase YedK|nr:SOS response-associated peptidase [Pseudomonadales bacterium]MDP4639671.1 SOS response-associated peptidase [Pseudomonadales bacterium]MDP4912053.1 SOS response-associated peptidase [Pseudomonadales bacterium]